MTDPSKSRSASLASPHRKLTVGSLKRCPLCGAVNARLNGECFVCRWHGEFDHDPVRIEDGLSDLLARCPELADAIMAPAAPKPHPLEAIRQTLARVFRRRIDLLA